VRSTSTTTRGLEEHPPVLVDVASAVEDQRVLSSELVHVDQSDLVIRGAGRDELSPGLYDAAPEGRRGYVHHHFRPARRAAKRRSVRNPEVLADLDRESPERKPEQKVAEGNAVDRRHHARDSEGEDPALVEHVVVREVLLGNDPGDFPRRHHGDRVVEKTPVGHGEAHGEDRGEG